jgi:hypothetical protein
MTDDYCTDPNQWGLGELKDDCFVFFLVDEDETKEPAIGWYHGPVGRVGFATK